MFVVRNVFHCKPGKAKDLVAKFKAATPQFAAMGLHNTRILTDTAADFWTVVVESESDNLHDYMHAVETRMGNAAMREAMAGYMDLVQGGRREIFHIE